MKSVIVTVTDEALPVINQLADRLRGKGLNIQWVLPIAGVITGTASASDIKSIKKVKGVLKIEDDETTTELPPPTSKIQ